MRGGGGLTLASASMVALCSGAAVVCKAPSDDFDDASDRAFALCDGGGEIDGEAACGALEAETSVLGVDGVALGLRDPAEVVPLSWGAGGMTLIQSLEASEAQLAVSS